MIKRLSFPFIGSIILLLLIVALFIYFSTPSTPQANTNTAVSYTTVTDNELVILHRNATATAEKVGIQLTLTSHEKTDDRISTTVTVQDLSGNGLGEVQFDAINSTQAIGDDRFQLVSATKSAVQILVFATVVE